MLVIDENSKTFQREVIFFLISKLLESSVNNPTNREQILNEINQYLEKNDIYDVEKLLSKSSEISKILRVSSNAFSAYVSKNVFKVIQYLKKEKETINLYISDEKNSFLNLLKILFPSDLSNSYFTLDNEKYVLVLPKKRILENTHEKVEPTDHQKPQAILKESAETKQKPSLEAEVSIIQEILQKFSNLKFREDLTAKLMELDKVNVSLVSTKEKEDNEEKAFSNGLKINNEKISKSTPIIEESLSIIQELLEIFSEIFPIKKDLQNLLKKEEQQSIQYIEPSEDNKPKDLQEESTVSFIPIPFTISDYLELRKKIQHFKTNQDIANYQNFVASSSQSVKACIALMNIQKKENEPAFDLKIEIQKASLKLNIPYNSLLEFYQRLKKYNVCLGAIKQAGDYLQKTHPDLYKAFIEIKEPLLDFLSQLEPSNDDFETDTLQKKLKILLLSIQEESTRNKINNFLVHLTQKMLKLL